MPKKTNHDRSERRDVLEQGRRVGVLGQKKGLRTKKWSQTGLISPPNNFSSKLSEGGGGVRWEKDCAHERRQKCPVRMTFNALPVSARPPPPRPLCFLPHVSSAPEKKKATPTPRDMAPSPTQAAQKAHQGSRRPETSASDSPKTQDGMGAMRLPRGRAYRRPRPTHDACLSHMHHRSGRLWTCGIHVDLLWDGRLDLPSGTQHEQQRPRTAGPRRIEHNIGAQTLPTVTRRPQLVSSLTLTDSSLRTCPCRSPASVTRPR